MSAHVRPRSVFALVVEGTEVLCQSYAIERGRVLPRAFEDAAQAFISGALDAAEVHKGQVAIRYRVIVDGVGVISSFATRPVRKDCSA